ncbi:hypothetical protein GCM10010346_65900 [Streptomyces chryseus]|uniref:Uncharacterized protein n=1 Tax=Streptomyces chryseus TaxID=68186 RepID=A0ABQ3ECE2_9ACTN|nr:hypothetical protein GCM10010346_65900 [Streptomyces chryseus]
MNTVKTLPAHLKRSLTWEQGSGIGCHHEFTVTPDVPVYFYDPASPFPCRSNENVNGPLRQYFPKGTDLSVHSPEHLAAVAAELDHDVDVAELPATGSARRGGHPGSPSSPPGRSRSPRPASRRSPGAGSRCRR